MTDRPAPQPTAPAPPIEGPKTAAGLKLFAQFDPVAAGGIWGGYDMDGLLRAVRAIEREAGESVPPTSPEPPSVEALADALYRVPGLIDPDGMLPYAVARKSAHDNAAAVRAELIGRAAHAQATPPAPSPREAELIAALRAVIDAWESAHISAVEFPGLDALDSAKALLAGRSLS